MKDQAYYDKVYAGTYRVDEDRVRFIAGLCTGRILDLGCGDGALSVYHPWQNGRQNGTGHSPASHLGLDFSAVAIERARSRGDGWRFEVRDFTEGRFPGGKRWDTVVLGQVLEHLDRETGTRLIRRVGRLHASRVVVSVPNGDAVPDPAHVTVFTEESFRALLEPLGDVVVHPYSDRYLVATVFPGGRPRLSCVIITKNEEELIGLCLDSLSGVGDELVVVDTGSTDGTVAIARSKGARIGWFPWVDDFAAARNHAEALCCGEYVYWQDADEVLVEGKDLLRAIAERGDRDGVRPRLITARDGDGAVAKSQSRQELLHRNNDTWCWHGAAHNWLSGPTRSIENGIVVEHLNRPSGDRPNFSTGDAFAALRKNLGTGLGERDFFYLAREHWYAKQYQECIALVTLMLEQPRTWAVQRSHAALIAGASWHALGDDRRSEDWFLRAVGECPRWAEPFFALGRLCYTEQRWAEGAAWLLASTAFDDAGGYFTDDSVYTWRRYDLLAVCMYRMGRYTDALRYGEIALRARPRDARLLNNIEYYRKGVARAGAET